MLTKEEVADIYAQNLVLTRGTEKWVPMSDVQVFDLVSKNYAPEDIADAKLVGPVRKKFRSYCFLCSGVQLFFPRKSGQISLVD